MYVFHVVEMIIWVLFLQVVPGNILFCSVVLTLEMKPQGNGVSRVHKANNIQVEGPNWMLIAAGALLSTLSVRLGYKLKQALDSKPKQNATTVQKGTYGRIPIFLLFYVYFLYLILYPKVITMLYSKWFCDLNGSDLSFVFSGF